MLRKAGGLPPADATAADYGVDDDGDGKINVTDKNDTDIDINTYWNVQSGQSEDSQHYRIQNNKAELLT